jgi:hypothetical protein
MQVARIPNSSGHLNGTVMNGTVLSIPINLTVPVPVPVPVPTPVPVPVPTPVNVTGA